MKHSLFLFCLIACTVIACHQAQNEKPAAPAEDPCAYCLLENARPSSLGNGPFLSKNAPAYDSVQLKKLAEYFNHNLDSAFELCASKFPEQEGLSKSKRDSLLTSIQLWYQYYNIYLPDTMHFPKTPNAQGLYELYAYNDSIVLLNAAQYHTYRAEQFRLGDSLLNYREKQLRDLCAAFLGKKAEEIDDAILISVFYRGRHLSTDASILEIRMTDSAYAFGKTRYYNIRPENYK